jgi:hypothetical protein
MSRNKNTSSTLAFNAHRFTNRVQQDVVVIARRVPHRESFQTRGVDVVSFRRYTEPSVVRYRYCSESELTEGFRVVVRYHYKCIRVIDVGLETSLGQKKVLMNRDEEVHIPFDCNHQICIPYQRLLSRWW